MILVDYLLGSIEVNDRDRILLELKMLEQGIVPNIDYRKNVSDQLALMPPEESRRAKRKFRKLKRRALKKMKLVPGRKSRSRMSEKCSVIQMLARDRNT